MRAFCAKKKEEYQVSDRFANIFDGFSIGSNDLPQLTLGLDRDSGLVYHIFDENNDAVKSMVKQVIEVAKRRGRRMRNKMNLL